jgi:hypothetical protein
LSIDVMKSYALHFSATRYNIKHVPYSVSGLCTK